MRKKAAALLPLVLACLAAAGCGERSDLRIAHRILESHRRRARVKPLPGAQVVRLALAPTGRAGEPGTALIEWDGGSYRETVSSAGWTRIRGIQGGKAFWTDEDGVTRVCSEPVLAELLTRSYFWRRTYLFDDLGGAKLSLGPADEKTVSVELRPRGGNLLRLTFVQGGDLKAVRSPGFALDFRSPSGFTDRSGPGEPVEAEIRATHLPSASLADKEAGGWSARWAANPAEAPLARAAGGIVVDGAIGGVSARILFDASAEGPLELRSGLARGPGVEIRTDVYGRKILKGRALAIGAVTWPELFVRVSDDLPQGADARAGGVFLRETIVEIDPEAAKVRFHDPRNWDPPPGYFKGLLDDDGDRAVAIVSNAGKLLRLRAGVPGPPVAVSPQAAQRAGLPEQGAAELKWGTAPLPPLPVTFAARGFDPEWGDDGALGQDVILRFHAFLDLPRRWAYLRSLEAPPPER